MTAPRLSLRARLAQAALVLTLGLVLTLLAGGCGKDDPPPPASRTPAAAPAPPKPPRVGACYHLTFQQAAAPANASPAVPCSEPHTAVTIHVGRINPLSDGHLVAVDSRRVQEQIARTCPGKLAAYLGGDRETRRLSRFEAVWFSPTLKAADQGAIWYRCDLVLLAGRDQLGLLPRNARNLLAGRGVLDRYGTCANTAPAAAHFVREVCSRKHSWRVATIIDLEDDATYLGRSAGAAADADCRARASSDAGTDLRFTWSFEWPTRAQWEAGQRWGYCWLPTT